MRPWWVVHLQASLEMLKTCCNVFFIAIIYPQHTRGLRITSDGGAGVVTLVVEVD